MSTKEDEVTSEIHQAIKQDTTAKPSLTAENIVSRFSFKYPDRNECSESTANGELAVDEDGDLIVCRKAARSVQEGSIIIAYHPSLSEVGHIIDMKTSYAAPLGKIFQICNEKGNHSFSTTLDLVGRQIWRGALLLGDFVLHHGHSLLQDRTVLELGSGVGLTSIVAAMYAAEVVCTDIDMGGILQLIKVNAARNRKLLRANFVVLGLDFFANDWSPNLETKLTNVTVVLVADVIYDNDVTEAFVNTLQRLLSMPPAKTVYIALEKRYVFTIADLDSVAPCYEYFLQCLRKARAKPPGSLWQVEQLPIDFPQYFNYERVKDLVLWRISSGSEVL